MTPLKLTVLIVSILALVIVVPPACYLLLALVATLARRRWRHIRWAIREAKEMIEDAGEQVGAHGWW